ncbi:unnamed protein product [Heligmosomoides polygyrus]|uniref:Transmembrane protein n=1 Tax=Heligmosomoides polygyrus TaxID=6339 RepID=A0A183G367_HELPZ|nr:unnamed protein product [Heligmosomoides polygyrus]
MFTDGTVCSCRCGHRAQRLRCYGCVSFGLITTGLVFTVFAIFQKDSQIGKVSIQPDQGFNKRFSFLKSLTWLILYTFRALSPSSGLKTVTLHISTTTLYTQIANFPDRSGNHREEEGPGMFSSAFGRK